MEGKGILLRDAGKLPPSARKQLEKVGNEKITKIVAVRTPLSSTTRAFLNIISLGQFEKISKQYFDDLFHLAFWINDKYNLEKNEVILFGTKNPIKSNSEIKDISVSKDITFNELIENTRKYMGDSNFTSYSAEKNNCQNFLNSILTANGIGNEDVKKWIKQDTDKVFKEVPAFAKVLGDLSTTAGAVVNRLIEGEGRPRRLYMTDDGRYYYMAKKKKRFIKIHAGISQKQIVKINIGNLVKPRKKRRKRNKDSSKSGLKTDITEAVKKFGATPPPVMIKPKPDDSKELLKAIEGIAKLVPREPTRLPEPKPKEDSAEITRLETELRNAKAELEASQREELEAKVKIDDLEKEKRNIDNEILGARLEGSRNMLIMKKKEIDEKEEKLQENVGVLNGIITKRESEIAKLERLVDELSEELEELSEKKLPKGTASLGKKRIESPYNNLFAYVEFNERLPRSLNEFNEYIFEFYDTAKYTKISKLNFENLLRDNRGRLELRIKEIKAAKKKSSANESSPIKVKSSLAGKGVESDSFISSCFNPLSIMYGSMPIGIGVNNPNIKTDGMPTSTTPVTTETKKEEKKDEPQKPDVPQQGKGLFGDVINLFNPSTTMTTKILGLGFGMAGGGCNGMSACMCGEGEKNFKQFDGFTKGEEVDGLYNDEIEKIADNLGIKVPVIASDEVYKIVDMITPNTKEFGFVINTDNSKGKGKHWRSVFIDNDDERPSIEFFDPLGDAPEIQLIQDMKGVIDKLDNEKYFLFKENMVKRQSDEGFTANLCGHFSVKFLEDRFNGVPWADATGFKKCMNQENEGKKYILKSVKKYENYL